MCWCLIGIGSCWRFAWERSAARLRRWWTTRKVTEPTSRTKWGRSTVSGTLSTVRCVRRAFDYFILSNDCWLGVDLRRWEKPGSRSTSASSTSHWLKKLRFRSARVANCWWRSPASQRRLKVPTKRRRCSRKWRTSSSPEKLSRAKRYARYPSWPCSFTVSPHFSSDFVIVWSILFPLLLLN